MTFPAFTRRTIAWVFVGGLLACGVSRASAQVVAPPPPAEYRVVVRYRIRAAVNQRLPAYLDLLKHLQAINFHKDPGLDTEPVDPDEVRMTGTIAAANARKILHDGHVKAILLYPVGYELKPGSADLVPVSLELAAGLRGNSQRILAAQVVNQLSTIGFQEATGYDDRDGTRIVGRIPLSKAELLLEDLRWQNTGWLVPGTPASDLPYPLRSIWPIRVVELLPEPAGVVALNEPSTPVATSNADGVASAVLALKDQATVRRLEVAFATPVLTDSPAWLRVFSETLPNAQIEGRFGNYLTIRARPDQAAALGQLPGALSVRLPPLARTGLPTATSRGVSPKDLLQKLGILKLPPLPPSPYRRNLRLAVIADDFRGVAAFIGKELPANTQIVDLTAESEPTIEPKPYPDNGGLGSGTLAALAAAAGDKPFDLILIRVDPEMPSQLLAVARYIHGDYFDSDALNRRSDDLAADELKLQKQREQLLAERSAVFEQFRETEANVKRRQAFFQKEAESDRLNELLHERQQRYLRFIKDLQSLSGIEIVANTLIWPEGYSVDGGNPLTRYLDQRFGRRALWFQAAGDIRGQTWAGTFRDANENGVMEFAPAGAKPNPGRWTTELNFLGWQNENGERAQELPTGNIRIALQWREPHDPEFKKEKREAYRHPLADLRLVLLRQRDPNGAKLATDNFEVAARVIGLPTRLAEEETSAVYEQVLEYSVPAPGRYALRIEGHVPERIRPVGAPDLQALRRVWELYPRLFISAGATTANPTARPIFFDYATDLGNLGMPADAQSILSVGGVDLSGQREVFASSGPALGEMLHAKPDLVMVDRFLLGNASAAGSAVATAFTAGAVADALLAGLPCEAILPNPQEPAPAPLRLRQITAPARAP
jgi:hypothetical protein